MRISKRTCLLGLLSILVADVVGQQPTGPPSGFLVRDGKTLFPLGSYEMPGDSRLLQEMAEAGFNLVRCRDTRDLDQALAARIMGWVSLPLVIGPEGDDALRRIVKSARNHPALAVWEGPDEMVWNFTANSGLYKSGVYPSADEWWRQTPTAVEYSETQARKIIPGFRAGSRLVRDLDGNRHPIWMNEAARSDAKFIREYLDRVDFIGCDTYPIHDKRRQPTDVGDYTQRYQRIGRGKPVWMVLQGFSWHELKPPRDESLTYPTFVESRFMAYDSIVHGARGVIYWGTEFLPSRSAFRESLHALVSELSALQPFLVAPDEPPVRLRLLDSGGAAAQGQRGVRFVVRRSGDDGLVVLVNEDAYPQMSVELTGLEALNGRDLRMLYGTETLSVRNGECLTRLKPMEVKVFATSREFESQRQTGRAFTP